MNSYSIRPWTSTTRLTATKDACGVRRRCSRDDEGGAKVPHTTICGDLTRRRLAVTSRDQREGNGHEGGGGAVVQRRWCSGVGEEEVGKVGLMDLSLRIVNLYEFFIRICNLYVFKKG